MTPKPTPNAASASYTPGPWYATGSSELGTVHGGPNHQVIVPHGDNSEEKMANARLIAAAPETAEERDRLRVINAQMLNALEAIADAVIDDKTNHAELSALLRAIAKTAVREACAAEGEK